MRREDRCSIKKEDQTTSEQREVIARDRLSRPHDHVGMRRGGTGFGGQACRAVSQWPAGGGQAFCRSLRGRQRSEVVHAALLEAFRSRVHVGVCMSAQAMASMREGHAYSVWVRFGIVLCCAAALEWLWWLDIVMCG